jgi:hypothetical protein
MLLDYLYPSARPDVNGLALFPFWHSKTALFSLLALLAYPDLSFVF